MKHKNFFYKKILKNTYKFFIVLIAFIFLIDLVFVINFSLDSLKKFNYEQNLKQKQSINSELFKIRNLLEAIARDPSFSNTEECIEVRSKKLEPYKKAFNLEFMEISNSSGCTSRTSTGEENPVGDIQHFHRSIYNKKTVISSLVFIEEDNKKLYVICTPLFDAEKNIVGIVSAGVNFKNIAKIISKSSEIIYSALINRNYDIIAHSYNREVLGRNIFNDSEIFIGTKKDKIIENFKNKTSSTYYSFSFRDKTFYKTKYDYIENTNWIFLSRINLFKAFEGVFTAWILKLILIIAFVILVNRYYKHFLSSNVVVVDEFIEKVAQVNTSKNIFLNDIFMQSLSGFKDPLTNTLRKETFMNIVNDFFNTKIDFTKKSLILFIDLDNLKTINDTLGHEYGDIAIKDFSNRLYNYLKRFDDFQIGRYGGDEFIAFIPNIDDKDILSIKKEINYYLLGCVRKSHQIINYSASIGGSIFNEDSKLLNELIQFADEAVYEAKKAGKNTIKFYKK